MVIQVRRCYSLGGGKISTDHPKSAAFPDRKCIIKHAKELTVMRCLLRIITIINSLIPSESGQNSLNN